MNIPATLVQGDTASWTDDAIVLADGRTATSAAWTLRYALRGPTGLDIDAVAEGTGWRASIGLSASAALAPGLYTWAAFVTRGTFERETVARGQLTVQPDLAQLDTGSTYDGRSQAQRALADCEAALAKFNASGGKVKRYDIAGRSMEFATIGELLQLQTFWRSKVYAEQGAAQTAAGAGNPRNLFTRFVRPQ